MSQINESFPACESGNNCWMRQLPGSNALYHKDFVVQYFRKKPSNSWTETKSGKSALRDIIKNSQIIIHGHSIFSTCRGTSPGLKYSTHSEGRPSRPALPLS